MSIHRASDSLSRCDPNLYSNMYDVRKRSDIKHEPIQATQPTHKDTIEISRDKLKEEALNRLRHTSKYMIAHNGFMRIGKYLFLAVALPPYLALYGLPKWLLVEGLPSLFSMQVWVWNKIQQKAQKPIDAGKRKIIQVAQFMRNVVVQVLIQPITRLALEIRRRIERMREQTLQFFNRLAESVKSTLTKPFITVAERFKGLQKRLSQLREKTTEQAHTLSTRLQESIQWIKQSPQLLWNWGQAQFQKVLNGSIGSWRIKWNKKFQTSQGLAQKGTEWISTGFTKTWNGVKQPFEPFVSFYRQQVLPQWRKLKETCTQTWQKLREFFQRKHQGAVAFLQKKQEKLKRLSYQNVLDYILSHTWMGKLPANLQNKLKKWLSHHFTRAAGEKFIKFYSIFAHGFWQFFKYFLNLAALGMKVVLKLFNSLQNYVKIGNQKALAILGVTHQIYQKIVRYTLYYSLLGIIMTSIIVLWGIKYLSNLMNTLTPKLSFRR